MGRSVSIVCLLWLGASDKGDGHQGQIQSAGSAVPVARASSWDCPWPFHMSSATFPRAPGALGTLLSTPVFDLGVWRDQESGDLHSLLDPPSLAISEASL